MSDINEIKKLLYREKPIAHFLLIKNEVVTYTARLKNGGIVHFEIPVSDMGDVTFRAHMDGQHLNRWIVDEPLLDVSGKPIN